MAAPMATSPETSSSEDEEENAKFKEAVFEIPIGKQGYLQLKNIIIVRVSKRRKCGFVTYIRDISLLFGYCNASDDLKMFF
jgi:hypothetical protein